METVEELASFLREATAPDARDRLLARGGAWSLMREDGVLPDGAPQFARRLEVDLAEYGFSVLRAALALYELEEESALSLTAFERSASAFEALVRNGDPHTTERGFHRTVAACCYHLASYSAIAFSLFAGETRSLNWTCPGKVERHLLSVPQFVRTAQG